MHLYRTMWNDCRERFAGMGIRDVQEMDERDVRDEGHTDEGRDGGRHGLCFHERNGFYVGAPSLQQFGAHTKR